jgi:hypothetical protein
MGWFEVINTTLNFASTAAMIGQASTVNQMHQSAEERAKAAQTAAQLRQELARIVYRLRRSVRKMQLRCEQSPKAVMILCDYYDKTLESANITPELLNQEDKGTLIETLDCIDRLKMDVENKLGEKDKKDVKECVNIMLYEYPRLSKAISDREIAIIKSNELTAAQGFLNSSQQEWLFLTSFTSNVKHKRITGFILWGMVAILSCVSIPVGAISSGTKNYTPIVILAFLILVLGIGGAYLLIKSRNQYKTRLEQLKGQRDMAMAAVSNNSQNNAPLDYPGCTADQLRKFRAERMEKVSKILEQLGDPNEYLASME